MPLLLSQKTQSTNQGQGQVLYRWYRQKKFNFKCNPQAQPAILTLKSEANVSEYCTNYTFTMIKNEHFNMIS